MFHAGLVSITFRKYTADEIVALAVQARLEGIEWGADIHVLPGDIWRAREVRNLTVSQGLTVTAYGSYYRLGLDPASFDAVLASAIALGAPSIRVWAGQAGSRSADEGCWGRVVQDGRRIAGLAAGAGLSITMEFHNDTLNDSASSTRRLVQEIGASNLFTGWQPLDGLTCAENAQILETILPWLGNVHVFHWFPGHERHLLAEGAADWDTYLAFLPGNSRKRFLMLEFVKDDSPGALLDDARTLHGWLKGKRAK